jgi:hypothetical protein
MAGCGGSSGDVKGKVTYKGKELKGGGVSFVSTSGGPSQAGVIGEDGTYSIPNLQTGTYKVCVDTRNLRPPAKSRPMGPRPVAKKESAGSTPAETSGAPEGYTPSTMSMADAAIAANAKRYTEIPEKYAEPEQTDITYTVKGGDQTFDIELK